MPFLSDYVDMGIDGLQSFQPTAGNDLPAALREYGEHMTFITGIDILSGESLSPEGFADAIREAAAIGAAGSRFILGTTHMLQYTMPEESCRAMFDAVRSIQESGPAASHLAAGSAKVSS